MGFMVQIDNATYHFVLVIHGDPLLDKPLHYLDMALGRGPLQWCVSTLQ